MIAMFARCSCGKPFEAFVGLISQQPITTKCPDCDPAPYDEYSQIYRDFQKQQASDAEERKRENERKL